jgi:hypothetical protein
MDEFERTQLSGEVTTFFRPSLAHGSQELFLAGLHLPHERLVAGFFVSCRPHHHFRKNRREVDSFCGERINHFSAVGSVPFRGDNSVGFQTAQAVRQNIAGDFFIGLKEFVKAAVAANHHVSQDQERPAISKHLDGSVERAAGTPLGRRLLFRHRGMVALFTCNMQATLA